MTGTGQFQLMHTAYLENTTSRHAFWVAEVYKAASESYVVISYGGLPFKGPVAARQTKKFASYKAATDHFFNAVDKKMAGAYVQRNSAPTSPAIKVDFPLAPPQAIPAFTPPKAMKQTVEVFIAAKPGGAVPFI